MSIQPTLERTHPTGSGTQRLYRFANNFGASVVQFSAVIAGRFGGSYGAEEGRWELAVLRFTGEGVGPASYELTYDTPITDDVIGDLDEDEIQELLVRIRELPALDEE